MVRNKSEKANMLMSSASPQPVFAAIVEAYHKLLRGQFVSQRLHSNATYEYRCPVEARNDRL